MKKILIPVILIVLLLSTTFTSGCIDPDRRTQSDFGNTVPSSTTLPSTTSPVVANTGDTVSVYYTGTLDDGTVFDTNVNVTPLTFILGKGTVITGFEEAVAGMAVNDLKTVKIPPEKAYGTYNSSLVHVLNRSALPANMTPVAGQYYSIKRTTDGTVSVIKIINVTPTTITWDENHELAGKNLTFTIQIVSMNKGTV